MVGVFLPRPPADPKYPVHDFSVDLVPETIIHKKDINGTYHYLIKWKDVEQLSYVTDSYANEKLPQLVIAFHEKHIRCIDFS